MPRKPMLQKNIGQLMQGLSLAAVMKQMPPQEVKQALDETNTNSIRVRVLPAYIVVYIVVMLAFYAEASILENLRILMEPLRRIFGAKTIGIPSGCAITRARKRLGFAPFKLLFEVMAKSVATPETPGTYFKNYRVVAVDGTTVEIQDTKENRDRFGIHKNEYGVAGYPQVKAVVMVECGTRVPLGCAYGGCNESEFVIFDNGLLPKLKKDMLLLADRGYFSFARWKACAEQGAASLWRVRKDMKLRPILVLEDGSWLAEIRPSIHLIKSGKSVKGDKLIVRVMEYRPFFADGKEGEPIRLITTIMDPGEATANELCELFAKRWESETGFDELKTHLRGPERVLRSQLPDLVEQELYGFLLAYTVVRRTMTESARLAKCAPRDLSFIHAVRVIRRRVSFPPCATSKS